MKNLYTKSQIITHSFVNADYQNGNNDKRGEHIMDIRTEERIKRKVQKSLNERKKNFNVKE